MTIVKGQTVLLTGGTDGIGKALLKKILIETTNVVGKIIVVGSIGNEIPSYDRRTSNSECYR